MTWASELSPSHAVPATSQAEPLSAKSGGGSQCLRVDGELWYPWGHERVSLVRCSWDRTLAKDQTSARDHSGGRVSKARGRLAAPGVPALEAA